MKYAERVVGQVTEMLKPVFQQKTSLLLAHQKARPLHWQSLISLKTKNKLCPHGDL